MKQLIEPSCSRACAEYEKDLGCFTLVSNRSAKKLSVRRVIMAWVMHRSDAEVTVNVTDTIREKSRREGPKTRKLEELTSSVPSSSWLIAAGASVVGSLVLKIMGKSQTAIFVGEWAPTLLILGLYNKLVKVAGSQRAGSERTALA